MDVPSVLFVELFMEHGTTALWPAAPGEHIDMLWQGKETEAVNALQILVTFLCLHSKLYMDPTFSISRRGKEILFLL